MTQIIMSLLILHVLEPLCYRHETSALVRIKLHGSCKPRNESFQTLYETMSGLISTAL